MKEKERGIQGPRSQIRKNCGKKGHKQNVYTELFKEVHTRALLHAYVDQS